MSKLTAKRGDHYTLAEDSSIQVSLEAVGVPTASYSADWFDVAVGKDFVRLCFGQQFNSRLMSRVDVRLPRQQFLGLLEGSKDFFEKLVQVEDADPKDWELAQPVAPDGKNLLEDATVAAIAYSGGLAEINFYQVPALDVWLAQTSSRDRAYRGPRPVVTVLLLTSQLSWLITSAITLLQQGGE